MHTRENGYNMHPQVPINASAFSEARPGEQRGAERKAGARVRKSRQKEAAGAADAGLMQIEWSEGGV